MGFALPISRWGSITKKQEVERVIEKTLEARGKRVVNRNALKALFVILPKPFEALGQLFLGRGEARAEERDRVQQDIILDLVCEIDEAITSAVKAEKELGPERVVICAEIEASGEDAEEVTGVSVSSDAGPVEFKPGTSIKASGKGVNRITGLEVGRDSRKREQTDE